MINGKMTLNQPAGHLENNESLIDAVIRETQEETAWQFEPRDIVGIYRWQVPQGDTYIRYCFSGDLIQHDEHQALDPDIHQALWLSQTEFKARLADIRSPLVSDCLADYLAGQRYPLSLLHN
jgi:8-oxo-dGTP pyrophosphatase MutT (NUDIX family)